MLFLIYSKRFNFECLRLLGLLLCAAVWPSTVFAATINVAGACTLPDAIAAANGDITVGGCTAGSGADVLVLANDSYSVSPMGGYAADGPNSTPSITSTITIRGGANGTVIQRIGGTGRLFYVGSTGSLTLERVILKDGQQVSNYGGAIYSRGELKILDSTLSNNAVTGNNRGGAITHAGGVLQIERTDFIDNRAYQGAAIYVASGSANFTSVNFYSNRATDAGGGIYVGEFATLVMRDGLADSNTAAQVAGFLLNYNDATLIGTEMTSNVSKFGGGIYVTANGALTLRRVEIVGNSARYGGGFFLELGTALIEDSVIHENTAETGGGIDSNGFITITNSSIISNTGTIRAGGVHVSPRGGASIKTTLIAYNSAPLGGGIENQGNIDVSESRILDNQTSRSGAAIYQSINGTMTIDQSCVVNNGHPAVVASSNYINISNVWWGSPDGPSYIAMGAGDSIAGPVNFEPFQTAAILDCPMRSANLEFTKTATPTADLSPGDALVYTLMLTNTGTNHIYNVLLTEELPAAGFISETMSIEGASYSMVDEAILISSLESSQIVTVIITGQIDSGLTETLELTNRAFINHSLLGTLTASASVHVGQTSASQEMFVPFVLKE